MNEVDRIVYQILWLSIIAQLTGRCPLKQAMEPSAPGRLARWTRLVANNGALEAFDQFDERNLFHRGR